MTVEMETTDKRAASIKNKKFLPVSEDFISFPRRDLFVVPVFLVLLFNLPGDWFQRTWVAALTTVMPMVPIRYGRLIAKKQTDTMKEIAIIFSLSFCIMAAVIVLLLKIGAISQSGKATGAAGKYFFKVMIEETKINRNIEISIGICATLLLAKIMSYAFFWYLKIPKEHNHPLKKRHIFLGLYRLYKQNSLSEAIQSIKFSFDPLKLFSILVMKCICAGTACFASLSFVLLEFYPNIARDVKLTLEEDIIGFSILSLLMIFTVQLDDDIPYILSEGWKCISRQIIKLRPSAFRQK